jgi:hypothetical protein
VIVARLASAKRQQPWLRFARATRLNGTTPMRLLYPALTAAAMHALLLGVFVAGFGGDPSALTCTGGIRAGRFPYEHVPVRPAFGEYGYDGQFYYALARAPLGRHTEGFESDAPAKRQLRLLYPLVCWALAGGDHPVLLLWVLPLVNLAAVAGLAWLGALVAARQRFSPWWGVLLPLAVNAGTAALRDLTDVVSTFTLAALFVGWLFRRPWWQLALAGGAAVFSREQNAAALAIVFVCAAWERRWLTCVGLAAALALWVGWVAWLAQTYQESPFLTASAGNFTPVPFSGWYHAWTHLGPDFKHGLRTALCLLLLVFQTALALDLLRRREVEPAVRLAVLFGLGLMLIGGHAIYEDVWSFGRVYANLPLAVWLGCVQARRLWALPPLSAYLLVQWGTVAAEVAGRA